jgi:hypothetical protein
VVRSIYDHHDPDSAGEFVERLRHDLQDESCPLEVRSFGRSFLRWKDQINLIKRVKRAAFGMTRFRNFRIRVLLYVGKPNCSLLPTVTPR